MTLYEKLKSAFEDETKTKWEALESATIGTGTFAGRLVEASNELTVWADSGQDCLCPIERDALWEINTLGTNAMVISAVALISAPDYLSTKNERRTELRTAILSSILDNDHGMLDELRQTNVRKEA